MKNKIIYSDFNLENGSSVVIIENKKFGCFEGRAQLHPEDRDHLSTFAGCRYAEARANIACVQHQKKLKADEIKTLTDFEKILKNKKDYNHHSMEARTLRKRIYALKEEKQQLKDLENSMKKALRKTMDDRDTFMKLTKKL